MCKRKTCSSFYLLDFKGGPITKTGPKFKKPRFLSSVSNSLEQNPNHSNKTWSLSLSLSFYRVRVIQKHCSLLFICICRLNSCSPPCLQSALEEIVSSRLLEKLTVSSLSQFSITNFFIFKFVYRRVITLCWFVLNLTQQHKKSSKSFASVSGSNSMTS